MSSAKFASKWSKVILFGDSLTQHSFSRDGGWGSYLADFLIRKCDIIPRGFSGYNTRACKLILPGLLNVDNSKEVVAMTILLGANDAANRERKADQHVPVEEYGQNLKDMVEHCLSVGLRRDQIVLITVPAVDEERYNAHCKKEGKVVGSRDNKTTGTYASACRKVASEMGTSLVDLYSEMNKNENYGSYLNDGLHLSESGSLLLFNLLQPIISKLTSHIPEMLFPLWDDIENKDLESAKQSLKAKGWL